MPGTLYYIMYMYYYVHFRHNCKIKNKTKYTKQEEDPPVSSLTVTGHHTQIGGVWVWWEPPVRITDGRSYRRPAHGTLPEKPSG